MTGIDPLASELTVRRDGHGVALITLGGVGGQRRGGFTLSRSQYGRLRGDVNHDIYTVTVDGRRALGAAQRAPGDRQLVQMLNRLLHHNTVY